MRNFFLTIFCLLSILPCYSQTTIFELYDELNKEGYDVFTPPVKKQATLKNLYPKPPPPPPPPPLIRKDELGESKLLKKGLPKPFIKSKIKLGLKPDTIQLKNSNFLFREKGLWGLQDKDSQILIRPKFKYVLPDTIQNGFIGYINGKSNYYDSKEGAPLLDNSYYSIKVASSQSFIVQSENGLGLGAILNCAKKRVINT